MADGLAERLEATAAPRRQRRPKARDRETLRAILKTLLTNLALAAERNPTALPAIGVGLRQARSALTRYDRPGLSGLPEVVARMVGAGEMFDLVKSDRKGTLSTLSAGPGFREALAKHGWRGDHYGEVPGREVLWVVPEVVGSGSGVGGGTFDYADTEESLRLRPEVETINAALLKLDLKAPTDTTPAITTAHRSVRRVFEAPKGWQEGGAFSGALGGRLTGAWFQGEGLHHGVTLEGEAPAIITVPEVLLRLAYREVGATLPSGDPYCLPGFTLPHYRAGIEAVLEAMLFRDTPMERLPKVLRKVLPPGATAPGLKHAIRTTHPALEPVLEVGREVGLRLLRRESDAVVATLLALIGKGIPAMPLEGATLAVPGSKVPKALPVVKAALRSAVGCDLPVAVLA